MRFRITILINEVIVFSRFVINNILEQINALAKTPDFC